MRRRLLLALFYLGAPCAARAAAAARPTGLIMIDFDDLRADRVEASRDGKPVMPHLAAFASSATLFTDAVSQAPWTLPSTMSLFTSLYPHRHGVVNRFDTSAGARREESRLPPEDATLAEVLEKAGFETAAFTGDAGVDAAYGFSRGFKIYGASVPFGGFELTMPQALSWLEERGGKRPFFLFVHGYNLHGQHAPPAGFPPDTIDRFLELRRRTIDGSPLGADEATKAFWRRLYDARASQADSLFGAFWKEASRLPAARGALVIIVADHGEELFEHGGADHGMTLYDEVLRVPLIVRVPGAPPRRVSSQARLIDVMPTALDLLGVESAQAQQQMQGQSLRPELEGRPGPERDSLEETDFLYRAAKRAVRTADGWKLILDLETLDRELYDVRQDTAELHNLDAERPQKAASLEKELRRLMDLPPAQPSR